MKTIVTQIRQKRLMALVLFLLVGMTSVFSLVWNCLERTP